MDDLFKDVEDIPIKKECVGWNVGDAVETINYGGTSPYFKGVGEIVAFTLDKKNAYVKIWDYSIVKIPLPILVRKVW